MTSAESSVSAIEQDNRPPARKASGFLGWIMTRSAAASADRAGDLTLFLVNIFR